MRQTTLRHSANAAALVYLDHLKNPRKKLQSLHDAFRDVRSSPTGVVEFHKALCDVMSADGQQFAGVKVVPPTHELGVAFRGTHSICMPLFSSFLTGKKHDFNIVSDGAEFVECGLCVRLHCGLPADATVENLSSSGATIGPAIELTGTRFPFFHPSLADYAADIGGCVGVVLGKENQIQSVSADDLNAYCAVLTRDDEPIQVGSGQLCDGGPVKCVNTALQYAQKIGRPLGENSVILCMGISARSPSQPGKYMLNWGAYGSARCTLA